MKLRRKSNTTIEYILVANGSPIISPILPPDAFDNDVIDFLKRCPLDLCQVIDSLDFLESYLRNLYSYAYDFHVFNIKDYDVVKEQISLSKQIQVFFLDGKSQSHLNLYNELNEHERECRFFYFYNETPKDLNHINVLNSPTSFIEILIKNQERILEFLQIKGINISPSVAIEYKDFNEFYAFIPTRLNYFLLNRVIGNFNSKSNHIDEEEIVAKQAVESRKANLNKHSFERQNQFIKQIKKVDFFCNISYQEKILKQVSGIEPILAPLIVVLPFHNPDLKDIYGDKEITSLLQVEQTENYINLVESRANPKMVLAGMDIQRQRIKYLDDVSFLHSSFNFSPVVRLPMKGKSIYRELSFFRPQFFPNISISKNRRKLKKTITKFGDALQKSTLSSELQKVLQKRNGQIVAISDLPIEWTLVDGIPLSFTHDICRLPETSLHGLMSFYTSNQTFEYSIPTDIIKKTLVVLGTQEEAFKRWHKNVYDLSKREGFYVEACNTLTELKDIVKRIKPDFLIFDCHGGYDKETRSSFLHIGNDILTGEYIVKNDISAPIVFLSACGTAPTYGTNNPIANAFFQAGAISVTSTYLPISVDKGSILYLRILNKLSYAAGRTIHKNWLEFICHLIRTSSINDAYSLVLDKKENIDSIDFFNSNVHALTESLVFSKRRKLYLEMDKKLMNLTNSARQYYSEIIPEYLLYSNLGRGDLLLFDKWKNEHIDKNVC